MTVVGTRSFSAPSSWFIPAASKFNDSMPHMFRFNKPSRWAGSNSSGTKRSVVWIPWLILKNSGIRLRLRLMKMKMRRLDMGLSKVDRRDNNFPGGWRNILVSDNIGSILKTVGSLPGSDHHLENIIENKKFFLFKLNFFLFLLEHFSHLFTIKGFYQWCPWALG